MSEDFWGLLFYSDKLYVALNAITLGGSLLDSTRRFGGRPWTLCVPRWYALGILVILG